MIQSVFRSLFSFFQLIWMESLLLLLFLFTVNNYIGDVESKVNADVIGYYDYLPSAFIRHDLVRKDIPYQEDSALYKHVNDKSIYVSYRDKIINKYPVGTALLQSPFFAFTYFKDGSPKMNGYSTDFKDSIYVATLTYLFFSLYFFKRLLLALSIRKWIIFVMQFLLVFATGVLHYAYTDAGFSHIYSLFAITAFLYFSYLFFQDLNWRDFLWMCVFFGLVVLIRQINVILIFSLPFIAGSWFHFREGIRHILKKYFQFLTLGFTLFFLIISIQFVFWYLQTGSFFVYSYQGEGFNFSQPELVNILFSYKKGLFIYTPILILTLLGVIYYGWKKHFYLLFTWLFFFGILTYILASWHSWFYGCSYGLRAYVEFYGLFFIPFAYFLNEMNWKVRISIVSLSLVFVPVNVIQVYQYKSYILHWIDMDKASYWKVFLKTSDAYRGLLWREKQLQRPSKSLVTIPLKDISLTKNQSNLWLISSLDSVLPNQKMNAISLDFESDFDSESESMLIFSLEDTISKKVYYYNQFYVIHGHQKGLNQWHLGKMVFESIEYQNSSSTCLKVAAYSQNKPLQLKNGVLTFWKTE